MIIPRPVLHNSQSLDAARRDVESHPGCFILLPSRRFSVKVLFTAVQVCGGFRGLGLDSSGVPGGVWGFRDLGPKIEFQGPSVPESKP